MQLSATSQSRGGKERGHGTCESPSFADMGRVGTVLRAGAEGRGESWGSCAFFWWLWCCISSQSSPPICFFQRFWTPCMDGTTQGPCTVALNMNQGSLAGAQLRTWTGATTRVLHILGQYWVLCGVSDSLPIKWDDVCSFLQPAQAGVNKVRYDEVAGTRRQKILTRNHCMLATIFIIPKGRGGCMSSETAGSTEGSVNNMRLVTSVVKFQRFTTPSRSLYTQPHVPAGCGLN